MNLPRSFYSSEGNRFRIWISCWRGNDLCPFRVLGTGVAQRAFDPGSSFLPRFGAPGIILRGELSSPNHPLMNTCISGEGVYWEGDKILSLPSTRDSTGARRIGTECIFRRPV